MTFYPKAEIRYFARIAWLILLTICVATSGFCGYVFVRSGSIPSLEDIPYLVIITATPLTMIVLYFIAFHEKCFAKIIVTDTQIIWKCIFRRTKRMPLKDCHAVGVELEDSYNGLDYPFVYFTTTVYPKEFVRRINKLKNTDTFIKFWYTEQLAEYIIKNLPKEKTKGVEYYYWIQRRTNKK